MLTLRRVIVTVLTSWLVRLVPPDDVETMKAVHSLGLAQMKDMR